MQAEPPAQDVQLRMMGMFGPSHPARGKGKGGRGKGTAGVQGCGAARGQAAPPSQVPSRALTGGAGGRQSGKHQASAPAAPSAPRLFTPLSLAFAPEAEDPPVSRPRGRSISAARLDADEAGGSRSSSPPQKAHSRQQAGARRGTAAGRGKSRGGGRDGGRGRGRGRGQAPALGVEEGPDPSAPLPRKRGRPPSQAKERADRAGPSAPQPPAASKRGRQQSESEGKGGSGHQPSRPNKRRHLVVDEDSEGEEAVQQEAAQEAAEEEDTSDGSNRRLLG